MRSSFYLLLLSSFLLSCGPQTEFQRSTREVLIYSPLTEVPEKVVATLKSEKIDWTLHPADQYVVEDSLWRFSTIVLLGTELEELGPYEQQSLKRYVQAGGGLLGLDVSLDAPLTWPWLDSLGIVPSSADRITPVQKANDLEGAVGLPQRAYDGGRVAFGSLAQAQNLAASLRYLIGNNRYDLAAIKAPLAPQPARFSRIVLDDYDVNEPMELAVLPDGRVLFIERRGKMKLYSPETGKTKTIKVFDVCTEGNYEDGLLGLAADPHFSENGHIFLYYSPPCENTNQYLSRFRMIGDSLLMATEKVILKVPVQRETCCHSGGSVTFGPDGNLWLSTGDNTSSKESNGYSPLDARPGRAPFDAQKSSGNTNDLRGKILRIRPNKYGSYDIPAGNLFPKDGSQGRPEIYVMGARNPFRISVDGKRRFVYWGDVGPDAGFPDRYGPESYDEWNQARQPGNFGWPYFMGNNFAFPVRDFAADTVGPLYDPQRPVNLSPNNTGGKHLPPAQPAYIWYSKAASKEFPMIGKGSNSAMAGPVYYEPATATDSRVKLPDYFTGKWFIYEWARSWVQVVTMNEQGDLLKIEPFLEAEDFVKPIEMEIGPDGAIYMLEYGANYFMNNPEARLVKIEYAAGNRLPIPRFTTDQTAGAAPLTVRFDASTSLDLDPDDTLSYAWEFADGNEGMGVQTAHTFSEPGIYRVKLRVTDANQEFAEKEQVIQVGNARPVISLESGGNQDFYFTGDQRPYAFRIQDPEDEANGGIQSAQTRVNFLYVSDGGDLEVMLGADRPIDGSFRFANGLKLIQNSDCKSCHDPVIKSVGPSYQQIAEKYVGQSGATDYLGNKIITGGNGVWGEKIMAGHPQHSLDETREMARYILSLADKGNQGKLPLTGTIRFDQHKDGEEFGAYLLAASYTDKGNEPIASLSSRQLQVLRAPYLKADRSTETRKVGRRIDGDSQSRENPVLSNIRPGASVAFEAFDWTQIGQLSLRVRAIQGGTIVVRQGGEQGTVLGELSVSGKGRKATWETVSLRIDPAAEKASLYLAFQKQGAAEQAELFWLDWIKFGQQNQ